MEEKKWTDRDLNEAISFAYRNIPYTDIKEHLLAKPQPPNILARCLKSYPHEDDMREYKAGNLDFADIRVYNEGELYLVKEDFNPEYYERIGEMIV